MKMRVAFPPISFPAIFIHMIELLKGWSESEVANKERYTLSKCPHGGEKCQKKLN